MRMGRRGFRSVAEAIVVECALTRRASAGAGCPLCIVRPGPLRAPRDTVDIKSPSSGLGSAPSINQHSGATNTAAVVIR